MRAKEVEKKSALLNFILDAGANDSLGDLLFELCEMRDSMAGLTGQTAKGVFYSPLCLDSWRLSYTIKRTSKSTGETGPYFRDRVPIHCSRSLFSVFVVNSRNVLKIILENL